MVAPIQNGPLDTNPHQPRQGQNSPTSRQAQLAAFKETVQAIEAPRLQHYLPRNEETPSEKQRAAVLQFQRTDEFKNLAADTRRAMQILNDLQQNAPAFEQSNWLRLSQKIGFEGGPLAGQYAGHIQYDFYVQSCAPLLQLAAMAKEANKANGLFTEAQRDGLNNIATELASEITVCGPGTISHIHSRHLQATELLFPADLATKIKNARTDIARAAIREWAHKTYGNWEYFANNEIHLVNGWQKQLANELGLNQPVDDFYATDDLIESSQARVDDIKAWLAPLLSPENIVMHLGKEILDEVRQACDTAQPDLINTVHQVLDGMAGQWGNIDIRSVLQTDEFSTTAKIRNNPTLLAIDILNRTGEKSQRELATELKFKKPVHESAPGTNAFSISPPVTGMVEVNDLFDTSNHARLLQNGPLMWIERGLGLEKNPYERELVSFDSLNREALTSMVNAYIYQDAPASMWHVLHECHRNSDLEGTACFRQHAWNERKVDLWRSAMQMIQHLNPESETLIRPIQHAIVTERSFLDDLIDGKLDHVFTDEEFKTVADQFKWEFDEYDELKNDGIAAEQVLESHRNGNKLFCTLVEKLCKHTIYNANLTLDTALKSKNAKSLETVLHFWPENVCLSDVDNNASSENRLLLAIQKLPSAEVLNALLKMDNTYPQFSPQRPEHSPLTIAAKNLRSDLIEAMMDNNALPPMVEGHHSQLVGDLLASNAPLEKIDDTAVSTLRMLHSIDPYFIKYDLPADNFAKAFKKEAYRTAAEIQQLNGTINDYLSDRSTAMTLLQYAVSVSNLKFAKALLDAGADPNIKAKNHAGKTALHMAYRNNDQDMIKLLKSKGASEDLADAKGRLPAGLQNRSLAKQLWDRFKP